MPTGQAAPHRPKQQVIVIGAGLGGLAAALRARALGHPVTVVERLDQPGGRARTFRQHGHVFDAGPTIITAPFLIAELFALFGERLEQHVRLLPVQPWYRIRFAGGRHFDYGGSAEEMRAAVRAFAPRDEAGFVRLMARSRRLFEIGFLRHGTTSFHRLRTMLAVLPDLLSTGALHSMYGLVSRFITDPSLRQAFTLQTLLIGGHPYRTPGLYLLIQHLERRWGVWFAAGGTGAIVSALCALAERQGVEFRLGETVAGLEIKRDQVSGVRLENGTRLLASIVIANADPWMLETCLLPSRRRRRRLPWRLARLNHSMGLFVLYFGTSRIYAATAHHTIILGRRYRALLDEIFGPRAVVPEDPSLYLHRPTATDPDLAPPGHDTFYVLAPVPNLRAPIDWRIEGPRLRDRLVAMLSATELPDLARHITTERSMTPLDFAHDYLSPFGAGFSVAPELLQSAWFRFHNRSRIGGLYLVGAGTHPGAGVPGVLSSAKVVETLMRETVRSPARIRHPRRTPPRPGRRGL